MPHPPYGELTQCSLIWKRFGQRLPDRAHRHEEEQTGDAVGWHPCSYISSPRPAAVCPYFWFFSPSDVFEWSRDAADCVGFALFLLSEEERRKESYVSLCWSPVEQRPICTTLIPIWTLRGPLIGRSKSLLGLWLLIIRLLISVFQLFFKINQCVKQRASLKACIG